MPPDNVPLGILVRDCSSFFTSSVDDEDDESSAFGITRVPKLTDGEVCVVGCRLVGVVSDEEVLPDEEVVPDDAFVMADDFVTLVFLVCGDIASA